LKQSDGVATQISNEGFKASETLLGIETRLFRRGFGTRSGFKASETLLGIETTPFANISTTAKAVKLDSKPLKPF